MIRSTSRVAVLLAVLPMADPVRVCSVPGCGRRHKARGYCRTHYRRWQRQGDPDEAVPVAERYRSSLWSARHRVRTERGPATAQRCAECAGAAVVWSYDGSDPNERTDPARGTRYSLDPTRYRPRCRFCHRRAVVERGSVLPAGAGVGVPEFDVERAARLYRAGASARGIGALLRVSQGAVLSALRAHGVAIRPSRRPRPNPTADNSTDTRQAIP